MASARAVPPTLPASFACGLDACIDGSLTRDAATRTPRRCMRGSPREEDTRQVRTDSARQCPAR
eukprot:5399645-Prymnesium_polylepis.1